jgi:phosphomannomutase
MNPQIFREYDVRGLVDTDLTDSVVENLGRGLATMVKRVHGALRWSSAATLATSGQRFETPSSPA